MTAVLTHLPDAAPIIYADWFKTPAQAVKSIKAGRGATATGKNGAINVWTDLNGKLRAHWLQFHQERDARTFEDTAALSVWLKKTLPQIRKANEEAARQRRQIVAGRIGPWERGK